MQESTIERLRILLATQTEDSALTSKNAAQGGATRRLFEGYHEDIEDTCLSEWMDGTGAIGFSEIAFMQMKVAFGSVSREIQP